MTEFNPDTLATVGLQWFPRFKASQPISSATNSGAVRFTAPGTYSPEFIDVYLDNVGQTQEDQGSGWELELYDTANLGTTNKTMNVHAPGEDIRAKGPVWGFSNIESPETFQTPDLWKALDSASLTPSIWPNTGNPIDNGSLIFPILVPGIDNNGYEYAARFAGIDGAYTNERITRVSVVAQCQEYVDIAFVAGMSVTPFMYIDGIRYFGPTQKFNGETLGGHEVRWDAFYNPETRVSWKVPDVQRFAVGASDLLTACSAGWIVDPTGSANNLATILRGWLEIEFTTEDDGDPRLGYSPIRTPVHGWNERPLHTMLGDGTDLGDVELTDGHEYLFVLRQRSGRGRLSWRYLDPGDGLADIDPAGIDTPLIAWTADSYVLDSVVDTQTRRFAWVMHRGDGTTYAIGQPYVSVDGDHEPDLGVDVDWTPVHAGTDVYQFLGAGLGMDVGTAYRWVRLLVAAPDGVPDGPLVVTVTDSAGAPLGSVTFQPADLDDPIDQWQILEGPLDVAATGEIEYRIVPTSTATAEHGWRVQVASMTAVGSRNGPLTAWESLTFGGSLSCAHIDGADHAELDLCATIATVPAPPAGLAADLVPTGLCGEEVALSWDATALGGDFLRYEIDRSDERTDWHRVANITTEAVEDLADEMEVRFNVETSYRIRVRRRDWSASLWSATVTATAETDCCGYFLSSNVRPDLAGWFDDIGAQRTTELPEDVTYLQFQGRNFSVGFHRLEDDGARFTRTLFAAGLGALDGTEPTDTPGDQTFDSLLAWRASRGAGVPYVCVRTRDGDRWFCSIKIADAGVTRSEPDGSYEVPVEFTEVTNVPFPIDVTP